MVKTAATTSASIEMHVLPALNDGLDVEAPTASIGRESGERDPLLLRDKLVTDDQLDTIRHRKASKRKNRKVTSFYEQQNEHIQRLLKPLHAHTSDAADEAAASALKVKIAIYVSFGANIALAILQLYAAISSGSLSLFATMIDSVFDPFANLLLFLMHRASDKAEERKWPAGGSRFESIGNVIYAFIMIMVNMILIVQSIQEFVTHDGKDVNKFHLPSIIAVGIALATKFGLFLYCYAIRNASSQVSVLWQDHRNDLLTNSFGLLTSAGGSKLKWWLDPFGAMLIATVISVIWARTAYEHFTHLAGIAAPVEFQKLVIYKAMTFNDRIEKIDSCNVYHSGPNYIVEIDIVLPPLTLLVDAHDISQDLQDAVEALPDVSRCFVHVDHEVEHKPEHRKKV